MKKLIAVCIFAVIICIGAYILVNSHTKVVRLHQVKDTITFDTLHSEIKRLPTAD